MSAFIHPLADCQTKDVGEGTNIWQFCTVLPGAKIGRNCNICANCLIENEAVIGDNVTIKCGVQIWNGVRIEDDVFIGPNATFCNDKFPRSKHWPEEYKKTIVQKGASIGANATILPVSIGAHAMIGAGAVATKNVPSYAIVAGNPARIVGYADTCKVESRPSQTAQAMPPSREARLYRIPEFADARGSLNVIDIEKLLPFPVRRIFYTHHVSSAEVRGEHAHRNCEQFLIAIHGSLHVIVDDGTARDEYVLDSPSVGLHLPAGCWGIQYKHSPDSVLMVLASHPYDNGDYIRDYEEFRAYIRRKEGLCVAGDAD